MSFAHLRHSLIVGSSFTEVHGNCQYIQEQAGIAIHTLYSATSTGAAYDSTERHPAPKCHPGTRVELIAQVQRWLEDGRAMSVMWLHGPAGAGKSAIAQTICEAAAERGQLLASFFFWRASADRNNVGKLVPTLAYQIALSSPACRAEIERVVAREPSIVNRPISVQLERLIIQPLQRAITESGGISLATPGPFLIVIDGLDECNGSIDRTQLLQRISELVLQHRLPLRFLIASRPEPDVCHAFNRPELCDITTILSLHGDRRAYRDVFVYLRAGFDEIRRSERHSSVMQFMPAEWPSDGVVRRLVERSEGYFIYASTVLRYVGQEYGDCVDRLRGVLERSDASGSVAFAELDGLYRQILSACPDKDLLLRVLEFLMVPVALSLETVEMVLNLRPGLAMSTLRGMHSVLHISQDLERLRHATPYHASLREFLFDMERAGPYFLDKRKCHEDVIASIFAVFRDWDQHTARHLDHCTLGGDGLSDRNSKCLTRDRARLLTWLCRVLPSHCRVVLNVDPCQFVAIIRKSGPDKNAWKSLIEDASSWHVDQHWELLHMLQWIIGELERLLPQPFDLTERFKSVFDLDIKTNLRPQSDLDVQAIQHACCVLSPPLVGWRENRHPGAFIRQCLGRPTDFTTTHTDKYFQYLGCLAVSPAALEEFMADAEKCGVLYCPSDIRYARVAYNCLEVLTGIVHSQDYILKAIEKDWIGHLEKSTPGDPRLLALIRRLPPQYRTQPQDVLRIIQWLDKTPGLSDNLVPNMWDEMC